MKICFYSSSWRGGDGWYTHALAQSMAAAGLSVIFACAPSIPPEREARHPNIIRWLLPPGSGGTGGRLSRIVYNLKRIAQATWALVRARRHTDLYVLTFTHWLVVTWLQFLVIKMIGGRVVYVVHDPMPHAWSYSQWARPLELWMLRQTYMLPTHLVSLTEAGKKVLASRFGIPEDRISVIPHGAFDSGAAAQLPGNGRILLFGMLRRNKRILESIRGVQSLGEDVPDVRLVIAGNPHADDRDYWELCEQAIAEAPERIMTEIGFVAEARRLELFDECDAVLLPYEDFSSQSGVAVAAGLAARPVLGTNAGGIGELFQQGMDGVPIARPVTSDTIAEAIRLFRGTSLQAWRERSLTARSTLQDQLSWERIGERFADLTQRLP